MFRWLKKMFIPHEGNNHHPHFWKKNSTATFLALVLMVEVAIFAQSFINLNKDSYLAAILPAVLGGLTNEQRSLNGAYPLSRNDLLQQAAELKAMDMATRGYFSHNTPEGYLPWYWLEKVGYQYALAGENLAVNFTDSKDVVDAWMGSPTHRDNIVKRTYTETGIGLAAGTYEGRPAIFVAQFFGTPKVLAASPIDQVRATAVSSSGINLLTSSTTNAQVAGAEIVSEVENMTPLSLLKTSPRYSGRLVLLVLLYFVIASFLLILLVNRKIHHPKIIISMIVLMIALIGSLIFNEKFLKNEVMIGEISTSTSALL